MSRLVVISSDVNETYSFFLPIASMAWRKCGWKPLHILVGDPALWGSHPTTEFVIRQILGNGPMEFVPPDENHKVSTTAQVVRLLASAIPALEDSDYILTSDVDMLPLNAEYFQHQDWSMDFHAFGADAYADITKGLFPPKFPMCYLGARAGIWRDVMGIKTRNISEEVGRALSGRTDSWDNDEMYFSSKLFSHPIFEGEVQKISDLRYRKGRCELLIRTWPASRAARRVDREVWGFDGSPEMIDCHCFRPGFERVETLTAIVAKYFQPDLGWFNSYLSEYLRLRADHG
jgi:hypothetical protein